jgi:hypothetical protein
MLTPDGVQTARGHQILDVPAMNINMATRKKHTPEQVVRNWRPLIGC